MKAILNIYNFKTKKHISTNDIIKFSIDVKRNDISTTTIDIVDKNLIDISLNKPIVFGLNIKLDNYLIFAGVSQEIKISKNNKLSIKAYDINGYLNKIYLNKKISEHNNLKNLIVSFLRYVNQISGLKIYLSKCLDDKLFDIFTYDVTNDSIFKILQTLGKEQYFNFDLLWNIEEGDNSFDNDYILYIEKYNKHDSSYLLANYINFIVEDIVINFDQINTDILYYSKSYNVIYMKHKFTKYKDILPTFIKKEEIPYASYKNSLNNIHKNRIENNLIQYKEFNYKLDIINLELITKIRLGKYYIIPFKIYNKIFQQSMILEQMVYSLDNMGINVNLKFLYE